MTKSMWSSASINSLVIWMPKKKVCKIVGGVLSPLLANIALYGLQTAIEQAFPASPRRHPYTGERLDGARRYQWQPKVIVYADDFVVLHQDRRAIEDAKHIAQTWLGQMGLKIKEQKTRITHTLHGELGTPGFDFLGLVD